FATTQGYTGHQQLDDHDLIHMGGRVYDPTLGRFLSADLYVQSPYNSQSFNRYSYRPFRIGWLDVYIQGIKKQRRSAANKTAERGWRLLAGGFSDGGENAAVDIHDLSGHKIAGFG
ncbi:RHS repeat-associated core domain-containing protein, partial [Marinimicrobium sp. ARAG 43.8]|uniref:RHS repeat-associated core domain-containing protein n=1 Tax=Marinimicrobium sp. ARAG 43.8 TaxID=3418719 RepID=UPI003CE80BCA